MKVRKGRQPVPGGLCRAQLQRGVSADRHAGAGGGFESESMAGWEWKRRRGEQGVDIVSLPSAMPCAKPFGNSFEKPSGNRSVCRFAERWQPLHDLHRLHADPDNPFDQVDDVAGLFPLE